MRFRLFDGVVLGMSILLLVMTCGLYVAFQMQVNQQLVKWNGAQLIIERPVAIPENWPELPPDLQRAHAVYTNTVVELDGNWVPVDIQAVDDHYPLVGVLDLQSRSGESAHLSPGHVFVSQMFASRFANLPEQITVGALTTKLQGVIAAQDEVGGFRFNFNPRILMSLDDLRHSGLWREGSRVMHYYYFHGSSAALSKYEQQLKPYLTEHDVVRSPKNSASWQTVGTDRVTVWYEQMATTVWLLIVIAIFVWSRSYRQRAIAAAKILSSFGIPRARSITALFLPVLSAQAIFCGFMAALLLLVAMGLGLSASFYGVALVSVMLIFLLVVGSLGYAYVHTDGARWLYGVIALTFTVCASQFLSIPLSQLVFYAYQELLILGLIFIAALGLMRVLEGALQLLGERGAYVALGLKSNRIFHATTILVVSVICISFLVINFTLSGLVARWEADVPQGAPNIFLINVDEGDIEGLRQTLEKNVRLYPIVRSRIVAVNGVDIATHYPPVMKDPSFNRELNMTYLDALPAHNTLVSGQWVDSAPGQVALEEKFARRANIRLGDTIDISVYGQKIRHRVTALRSLRWQSLNPNFFVITSPDILSSFVKTYITSFHWPTENLGEFYQRMSEYPHITVLNIDAIVSEVRVWVGRLTTWVNAYALLISAMLVLCATLVLSDHFERMQINRRRQFRGGISAKMIGLGEKLQLLLNLIFSYILSLGAFYLIDALVTFGEGSVGQLIWQSLMVLIFIFTMLYLRVNRAVAGLYMEK